MWGIGRSVGCRAVHVQSLPALLCRAPPPLPALLLNPLAPLPPPLPLPQASLEGDRLGVLQEVTHSLTGLLGVHSTLRHAIASALLDCKARQRPAGAGAGAGAESAMGVWGGGDGGGQDHLPLSPQRGGGGGQGRVWLPPSPDSKSGGGSSGHSAAAGHRGGGRGHCR